MSLADMVPVVVACDFGAQPRCGRGRFAPKLHKLTPTERCARWRAKNRDRVNAYQRAWYAKRMGA